MWRKLVPLEESLTYPSYPQASQHFPTFPYKTLQTMRNVRSKTNNIKNALFLSVNVFSTKVLIGDTISSVSNWRPDRHFTWSSEPREGLACCSAKGVPSFLGYFKTLSIGPASGIEPATSRSAVNMLYRLS